MSFSAAYPLRRGKHKTIKKSIFRHRVTIIISLIYPGVILMR